MKVTGWVMTNRVGSKMSFTVTIDDEDLEGLSEQERANYIDQAVYEEMPNHVEWGWTE